VIGMTGLARRTSTDPQQQDQLDKVAGAGRTLAHLIDDLLDLSKIVAGRMTFESTTFSLRAAVHRCNSVISYKAAEKGLTLREAIDDEVPDALVGDPLRFEQILLNLLSNAVKFTASGEVGIDIGASLRDDGRVALRVDVVDHGVGMSPDEMAQLFKPFAQADASMSRKYGGTGLGLSICMRLAEMMDGDISVTSSPGQGSIFRATLCFGLGEAMNIADPDVAGEHDTVRYERANVLVVEDQPLNREIAEALLKLVGVNVRMAANGQEALDILAGSGPEAFDLVLMDIQMPVMDGLVATRELRRWTGFASLPVIAMTAHTMTHEKEVSRAAGMNDHIGKPFDNASFYRTLAKWIPAAKQRAVTDPALETTVPVCRGESDLSVLAGIDARAGIDRLAGSEVRYRHWLANFVEESPLVVQQIREALASGALEVAGKLAHAFKGRVGMLGMTVVHAAATAFDAALRQGRAHGVLLDNLAFEIERARADLLQVLDQSDFREEADATVAPAGPLPDGVRDLVKMLEAGDGGSAAAIERSIEVLGTTDWAQPLQRALAHARNFDYADAINVLCAKSGS
jgi:CheY-like chemotaxis protein